MSTERQQGRSPARFALAFRRWIAALLLATLAAQAAAEIQAEPVHRDYAITASDQGNILEMRRGEIAYSPSRELPTSGWQPDIMDNRLLIRQAYDRMPGHLPTIWARFRITGSDLSAGPQAMQITGATERFVLFLNGTDIYRSYGSAADDHFGWNRSHLIHIPSNLLRLDNNVVSIRTDSSMFYGLRLGRIFIGPRDKIQSLYNSWVFWNNTGPAWINLTIAILTIMIFVFFLSRPRELEFGWLSAVGIFWFLRNLHYYFDSPVVTMELFWGITNISMFILMACLYGFVSHFMNVNYRKNIIISFWIIICFMIGLTYIANFVADLDWISFAPHILSLPIGFYLIYLTFYQWTSVKTTEYIFMWIALIIAIAFSAHDFARQLRLFYGIGFYLQPYASLVVFSAFLYALGRRMLGALDIAENANTVLAQRIAETTASLEQSEAIRRELEVTSAVEGERERMMREIHDGIGSNLITALTTAERRQESPDTIAILRRSITDLKIAVDSLEPVEGDVVALLGNLRHRLEPELRDAGLSFVWNVREAPALPWLDAVGALHVLRILQEAIGNVLVHAETPEIFVDCGASSRDGVEGVEIRIFDHGRGFDQAEPRHGKGIGNMAARASAIGGDLTCDSRPGSGTTLTLWLPVTTQRPVDLAAPS